MLSVVIRSKNEEAWIGRCLTGIRNQSISGIETILVDNKSQDNTARLAREFGARVVTISDADFTYGRALNIGIDLCAHDTVILLSAHCIPVNELWAEYLSVHFVGEDSALVCGVYGKQEPLPETGHSDRRDLWTTFRDDRVFQRRDYFFHNANSAIRRSIWRNHPFDEKIRGVEDRAWARRMTNIGYKIIYEPHASVYHHHGIHQGQDERRARRVAEVIEYIRGTNFGE